MWNTWPQVPKATLSPFSLLAVGLAYERWMDGWIDEGDEVDDEERTTYSMEGSLSELRQIAHESLQMSQDQRTTAFHFLVSKRTADSGAAAAAALALLDDETGPSMSMSMFMLNRNAVSIGRGVENATKEG